MVEATQFVQFLVNGLVYGSILALGAIGLTLVYGILRLANFAHGDLIAVGAFLSLLLGVQWIGRLGAIGLVLGLALLVVLALDRFATRRLTAPEWRTAAVFTLVLAVAMLARQVWDRPESGTGNWTLVVATLLAVAGLVIISVVFEFAVWRPLRRRGAAVITLIIVSIGVALVLRNALLLRFGGSLYAYDRPTPEADLLLGIRITDSQQFALVAALLIMGLVHAFLKYTRTGKAMRALADDVELARVSGLDVDRLILYVWIVGGTLTALAGVLLSLAQNGTMNANMGFFLLLPLFASVILGGIGSPYGAIAGAFVVGIAMKTSVLWVGSQYEAAAAFVLLIVVLLVRPQGIFGGRIRG